MTVEEINALPPADAEQRHLAAEIQDPVFVDSAQHEFADRCGEACACQPRGEAGR